MVDPFPTETPKIPSTVTPSRWGEYHQHIPVLWWDSIADCRVIHGRVCGLHPYIYTMGLMVDLVFDGGFFNYSARYCYENPFEAMAALEAWDGQGDPPGPWVKEKVSERLGPGAHVSDADRERHERIRLMRLAERGGS